MTWHRGGALVAFRDGPCACSAQIWDDVQRQEDPCLHAVAACVRWTRTTVLDLLVTAFYVLSLSVFIALSFMSRFLSIWIWPLDPVFVRDHALRVYAQKEVEDLLQGVQVGVECLVWCTTEALPDVYQRPVDGLYKYWDEWGGWTGGATGLSWHSPRPRGGRPAGGAELRGSARAQPRTSTFPSRAARRAQQCAARSFARPRVS